MHGLQLENRSECCQYVWISFMKMKVFTNFSDDHCGRCLLAEKVVTLS